MGKERRNLSGIYFRTKDTGEWCNVCFEDLPEAEQLEILEKNNPEWVKSLAIQLANIINEIGNQFDLQK